MNSITTGKQKLDQHFLKNTKIAQAMAKAGEVCSNDTILEIGPGKGMLTKEIAKKAGRVIAIEIDTELRKDLSGLPANTEIIYGNALKEMDSAKYNKIIASIPYSITEPLFKKMIKLELDLTVLLVGKDFYELLSGKESKWGIIGKIFFDIKKINDVPSTAFEPEPHVDSAIVLFKKRMKELNDTEKIIKEIILQDDKKTKNALIYAIMRTSAMTKKQAREAVAKMNLPEEILNRNTDALSNEQFGRILEGINKRN
jgi:16S rRNA (adenine1518-N6/adenine1519-N6)-dimethyltransferase